MVMLYLVVFVWLMFLTAYVVDRARDGRGAVAALLDNQVELERQIAEFRQDELEFREEVILNGDLDDPVHRPLPDIPPEGVREGIPTPYSPEDVGLGEFPSNYEVILLDSPTGDCGCPATGVCMTTACPRAPKATNATSDPTFVFTCSATDCGMRANRRDD